VRRNSPAHDRLARIVSRCREGPGCPCRPRPRGGAVKCGGIRRAHLGLTTRSPLCQGPAKDFTILARIADGNSAVRGDPPVPDQGGKTASTMSAMILCLTEQTGDGGKRSRSLHPTGDFSTIGQTTPPAEAHSRGRLHGTVTAPSRAWMLEGEQRRAAASRGVFPVRPAPADRARRRPT
jgi:hypothetical protein